MNGHALIDQAIDQYQPKYLFAMFSGGHDSLVSTHLASSHPSFSGAVHINTGIGIEATRDFVRETCGREAWPLIEYRAKEDLGQDYREMVLTHGFPGGFAHRMMYRNLKERAIRKLVRDHKTKRMDRIGLITGVRSQESKRREQNVEPIQKDDAQIWIAIINDFSKFDVNDYLEANQIPRNPVVDLIHMSGECLCGAFAHPGELKEIELWFPEMGKRIRDLESEVRAAGHDWGWEDQPPKKEPKLIDEDQLMLCFTCQNLNS